MSTKSNASPSKGKTSTAEAVDRAWTIIEKIGTCMFVTRRGDAITGRPMSATIKRDEHAIFFLTDVRGTKDDEIRANPDVTLYFSDIGSQRYAAVSGTAELLNDRELIKELWTPFAKAWFDGPEDPDIRVLRVTPHTAEYWDTAGKVATFALMAAAAVTGAKPKVGDNRTVAL